MPARQYRRYAYRVAIDTTDRAAFVVHAAPGGVRVRADETCLRWSREPPLYLALVSVALFLLAVFGFAATARAVRLPGAARVLAGLFVATAAWAAIRFVGASLRWSELSLDAMGRLRWRERIGRLALSQRSIAVESIDAVLVVGTAPRRTVVLAGPRNVEIAVVFRERFMDPPGLARWLADALALLLARATERSSRTSRRPA